MDFLSEAVTSLANQATAAAVQAYVGHMPAGGLGLETETTRTGTTSRCSEEQFRQADSEAECFPAVEPSATPFTCKTLERSPQVLEGVIQDSDDALYALQKGGGPEEQEGQSNKNSLVESGLVANFPACKAGVSHGGPTIRDSARMPSPGYQDEPDTSQGVRTTPFENQSGAVGRRVAPVDAQNPTLLQPPVQLGLQGVCQEFTTLLIRNIPGSYSQDMLLMELQPDGTFDFFFLPFSFQHGRFVGHAFANFRSHQMALAFQRRWHRRFLREHGSTKHLDVRAAAVQGLEGNLAQFNLKSLARLHRANMLPAFFSESGLRMDAIAKFAQLGIVL
eukprot:TRINITY_DN6251_c0_g1_i1.p1 TRINITY_DN6251_c0_g1~~TRINITY_DN6251_c0_g1_i1.p1  ORF type:complete len:334 (+),score=54.26 TRINITY_DN6251_c0_g1_i1:68-1069(+)